VSVKDVSWVCCYCMVEADPAKPFDDDDAKKILTVVGGDLVCMAHLAHVDAEKFAALTRAVYGPKP
jgi:hypothetical protein